ncbi:MAG: hypothetical protein IK125_07990 [Lachnospiraceae bacterium]|nr:hypothetical protein [Lachnospiraceae bacterium]
MKVIDVYTRYYEASCIANGRERHAAVVKLTATSDAGRITYAYSVSFFPHDDEEDFAISYDAFAEETIYEGKGRRSKKRDAEYLKGLQDACDRIAKKMDGTIDWEKPLIEARLG